jgi:hypothetical protein
MSAARSELSQIAAEAGDKRAANRDYRWQGKPNAYERSQAAAHEEKGATAVS